MISDVIVSAILILAVRLQSLPIFPYQSIIVLIKLQCYCYLIIKINRKSHVLREWKQQRYFNGKTLICIKKSRIDPSTLIRNA